MSHTPRVKEWSAATLRRIPDGTDASSLFARAALLFALDSAAAVLSDSAFARSSDPLVSYEVLRARILLENPETAWRDLESSLQRSHHMALLFAYDSRAALEPYELDAIAGAAPAEIAALTLAAWTRHAARNGITPGQRLREHFRRLQYANSHFTAPWKTSVATAEFKVPRTEEVRWQIYMRYGEPHEIVASTSEVASFETWVYADPLGPRGHRIFHLAGANSAWGLTTPSCNPKWLLDRAHLDGRLGAMWNACNDRKGGIRRALAHAREMNREVEAALLTEGFQPYRSALPFAFAMYQFAAGQGSAAPEIVTAIRMPVPASNDSVTVALTVASADTARSAVSSVTRAAGSTAGLLTAVMSVQPDFVPALYRVNASMRNAPAGQTYGGPLKPLSLRVDQFGISDIVITDLAEGAVWHRNGYSLSPIVHASTLKNMGLYYEVYGVQPGDRLRTEIQISGGGNIFGGKKTTSVSFEDVADAGPAQSWLRELGHELPSGKYEVKLRIRSARTGQTLERTAALVLAE